MPTHKNDPLATDVNMVQSVYQATEKNLQIIKSKLNRELTLAEKILFGHLSQPENQELNAGQSILQIKPDRVCRQDATAQMAI
jgi:aconitate hydratase